jgi:predicted nucleic acid-binding protein
MILADTSVWIDHFRDNDERLAAYLAAEKVAIHPFIIGELAMGNFSSRTQRLADLREIEPIDVATEDEVMLMIERFRLYGLGIGYIDAHLITATQLTPDTVLWTRDKRLHAACVRLGLELKDN